MSRTERQFRIRVSTRGADSMSGDTEGSGNVDLIFRDADIPPGGLPDEWGGQSIKPIEGRVRSRGFTVQVIDKGEQVTSELSSDFSSGTAFAEADILRRVVDLSTSDDGGTTWTVEATGRLSSISQDRDNPSVYSIETTDPIAELRRETVFEETKKLGSGNTPEATTSLFPAGIIGGWAGAGPSGYLEVDVEDTTSGRVTLKHDTSFFIKNGSGRASNVPEPVQRVLEDDLKPDVDSFREEDVPNSASSGDFQNVRLWVEAINGSTSAAGAQTNYEVFAPKGIFNKKGEVGREREEEGVKARFIERISVNWSLNQPAEGDTVQMVLYIPNIEPSSSVPLHLGGRFTDDEGFYTPENGLHPIEYLKKVLDETPASYNNTQLNTKKEEKADLPKMWPRLTGSIEAWSNLREHVFKPFGLAPVVNASGEIEVEETLMPAENKIPDVTNLTTLDESNLAGPNPPDLRIGGDEQVTKVVTQLTPRSKDLSDFGEQFAWVDGGQEPSAADMQVIGLDDDEPGEEKTYERHTDAFGVHEVRLDYTYLKRRRFTTEDGSVYVGKQVAEAILDRYAWGGVRTTATTMEGARGLSPLGYVLVNVSTYPGLQGQTRGEKRLLQVVTRSYKQAGSSIELLDAGPDKQPLPKPTISATVIDSFQIDVTIGGSGGTGTSLEGQRAVIEIARNSTQPASSSDKWGPAIEVQSQGTYSLNCLAPGTTYWIRAFQASEQRISSARTDPISKTTSTATAPSGLSVVEDLGCAVRLSWTNGDSSLRTQVLVDDEIRPPNEPPGASERFVRDLDPSTAYTFKVRHIGSCGGSTASASVSHTTSTASTGPRTGGIFLLVGERV